MTAYMAVAANFGHTLSIRIICPLPDLHPHLTSTLTYHQEPVFFQSHQQATGEDNARDAKESEVVLVETM